MTKAKDRRVLITDDERDLTDALAMRLTAEGGYKVCVAYDGAEGIKEAETFKPDVILLDISMPVVDGWEMCRRLRANPETRDIPIVIMTAWTTIEQGELAQEYGVVKVLLKPVDDAELMGALQPRRQHEPVQKASPPSKPVQVHHRWAKERLPAERKISKRYK